MTDPSHGCQHDQTPHLSALRELVDTAYGVDDVARGLTGLERRIRRRRAASYALTSVVVLALGVGLWRLQAAPVVAVRDAIVTEDGSQASALSQDTELRVEHQRRDEVELALARGKARFEVTRTPKRRYRVRAGEVTVEVLGTAFEVTRQEGGAHVRVEHGLVRVRWPHGETLLRAGEQGVFPPVAPPRVPQGSVDVPAPAAAAGEGPQERAQAAVADELPVPVLDRRARPGEERWRTLARAGKHREAFGSLGTQRVLDLEGLLLAADAARLSGHPREAAQHLERLVRKYPESAPARLAAFTLGRLQLRELNDAKSAARSFAKAYALDPRGPLAEDALAREAEAYRKSGDQPRAASVAARYLTLFPNGARRDEMAAYQAP